MPRILSRIDQNDGLIRHWLSANGVKGATVESGVVWVKTRRAATAMERRLDRDWFTDAPRPTVDWPRDED